jgi:hypothetical protein
MRNKNEMACRVVEEETFLGCWFTAGRRFWFLTAGAGASCVCSCWHLVARSRRPEGSSRGGIKVTGE